jgi:hypothetical protein
MTVVVPHDVIARRLVALERQVAETWSTPSEGCFIGVSLVAEVSRLARDECQRSRSGPSTLAVSGHRC